MLKSAGKVIGEEIIFNLATGFAAGTIGASVAKTTHVWPPVKKVAVIGPASGTSAEAIQIGD